MTITYVQDLQEDAKTNKKKQLFHCFMTLKFDVEAI